MENDPVQIFVDNNLNGLTDDTIVVRNEVTSMENNNISPANIPGDYFLGQNYPNPFNAVTQIPFGLPGESDVKIEVYSILGRRVAVPLAAWKAAGYHTVKFDASKLASGLYFYRIQSDYFIKVKKCS